MNTKKIALCAATFIFGAISCNNHDILTALALNTTLTHIYLSQHISALYNQHNIPACDTEIYKAQKILESSQDSEVRAEATKRLEEAQNEKSARIKKHIKPQMKELVTLETAANGYLKIDDCMEKKASFSKKSICECETEWEASLDSKNNDLNYSRGFSKKAYQKGRDQVKKSIEEIAKNL